MPTGVHSLSKNQVRLGKIKVNRAEWRHLTQQMMIQFGVFLSFALDFSIPQRALSVVIKNFIDFYYTSMALCFSRNDKEEEWFDSFFKGALCGCRI